MAGNWLEEKQAGDQSAAREQSVAVPACEPTRSVQVAGRNKGTGSESKRWLCRNSSSNGSNSSSSSSSSTKSDSKGLASQSAGRGGCGGGGGGSCEAAGSWLTESADSEDTNQLAAEKKTMTKEKKTAKQNRGNNSNYKSNKSHYTKIFRQYLPTRCSLNLSYALTLTTEPTTTTTTAADTTAKGKGNHRQCINKTTTTTSYRSSSQQQQHHYHLKTTTANQQSPTIFSKSIVSAFNKLRVSRSPSASPSSSLSFEAAEKQSSAFKQKCYAISEANSKLCATNDVEELHQQVSKVSRKRKGFLYLKANGRPTSEFSNDSRKAIIKLDRHVQQQQQQQQQQLPESEKRSTLSRRCRDLNNNSLSSLLSSSTGHDDHRTSLLDATSEEDDEQQQQVLSNKKPSGKLGGQVSRKMSLTQASVASAISFAFLTVLLAALALAALGQQQQQQSQPGSQQNQQQPFSRSQQPISGGGAGGARPTPQPAAGSLVASINCNKIRGHVTLTPNLRGGTTVSTQILAGPPGEVYQWSVHQFPVKPGAAMCSCSPLILGTKLLDLSEMHGNLPSDQEFSVQSSLNLFGADSPVGHSLMLRGLKTGMVACATFLPTSRKSNYRAKFHTPLSGSVTIFQTAFGTSFISHLMYSNGSRRHSMHRFDLMKSDDDFMATTLLNGAPGGSATGVSQQQQQARLAENELREHEHELSQCRRFNTGEPLLKNITYQLAVSTENFGMRGRTALVLPQIPFETFSAVYLVVYSEYDPLEPIACAPLKFVKPKTAAAKFQSVSVQGSVLFSQDSPYDVTVARINLNLPNSDGHSYGIDELPMIIRRKSDTRVCPNIREIIYNPHHVEPSSVPLEGEATSDQYAVGDLSGKYGSLTGKAVEKLQVNDYNLPLFGPISIVGRAMTVYSAEGVAIACSNVELTTPMTTAFATFDYGIQGQFIFRQPLNDCNGDTYVYIEVSKPVAAGSAGSQSAASAGSQDHFRSLDHNWHIHVNPVDSGLDHLSTTECAAAGPHYNPYNTSTTSIYSRDCTPFNVLRCELGDLSAKMFTIDIPPYRVKGGQEPDIGKFFGTDIDLPLCGPVSVVNRSVVVHVQDFGSQRLACSTVIEFKPRSS